MTIYKDLIDIRDVISRFEVLEREADELLTRVSDAKADLSALPEGADSYEIIPGVTNTRVSLEAALKRAEADFEKWRNETGDEFASLQDILERLKNDGGDEQWRGDWYPLTLVSDDYFTEYAKELTIECEYVPRDLPAWIKIDWEETAKDVMVDYTPITLNGQTYYYRAG